MGPRGGKNAVGGADTFPALKPYAAEAATANNGSAHTSVPMRRRKCAGLVGMLIRLDVSLFRQRQAGACRSPRHFFEALRKLWSATVYFCFAPPCAREGSNEVIGWNGGWFVFEVRKPFGFTKNRR